MNTDPGNMENFREEEEPSFQPGGRIEFQPRTDVTTHAALVVQADSAAVTNGAAGVVVGNEVAFSKGYSSVTIARELNLEKGGSQWLLAGEARIEQGGSGVVIARQVEAADLKVGILLAGQVNGDVQTLVDSEGAMRFGAALGIVLAVVMLIRRIFR
ncbi:MAG TPA: hypothetical protein VF960_02905 [Chloroflexota bacterium]